MSDWRMTPEERDAERGQATLDTITALRAEVERLKAEAALAAQQFHDFADGTGDDLAYLKGELTDAKDYIESLDLLNHRMRVDAESQRIESDYLRSQLSARDAEARALRFALQDAVALLENADCSDGYCLCGNEVAMHTQNDNHAPVDNGDYQKDALLSTVKPLLTGEPGPRAGGEG